MTRWEDVCAAAGVPYRLLGAVPELDGGDADPANFLIQGDNIWQKRKSRENRDGGVWRQIDAAI